MSWMAEDHRNAHRIAEAEGGSCPYDCHEPVIHRPRPTHAIFEALTSEQAEAAGVGHWFRVPYGNDPDGYDGVVDVYGFSEEELREAATEIGAVLGREVEIIAL